MQTRRIYIGLFVAIAFLLACKREIDPPAFPADARINFFNAAHYPTPYIAVDASDAAHFQHPAVLDFFGRQSYPISLYGGEVKQGAIVYMSLPAGAHQFYFADTGKVLRTEKELDMQAGSYTALYLTDSLLHYDVIAVAANPFEQHPGKIKIRIINLVPDLLLNAKMVAGDGSQYSNGLPREIPYKTITSYFEPDTSQALNGSFFFRFYHQDANGEVLVGTAPAVKATPGRAYTVVVQGYRDQYSVSGIAFKKGITAVVRVEN
ncbi:DUF4397 domain-containing protein [Chitinophaga barathri]|uniref:DUF4397 domain-containing protein n=1 Tax=Chitinophaga barathri TaxID=1647451 RepID=A0A3N4M9D3_9BACT|nr:DUF4397 domain-containing protein [Chitinophaga barathri]RPD39925.1 hypothetical protein EG028_17540 [Chitinophaga barathri]